MCIPLIYKDKVIGVLDIEHTRRNYFNDDHVRIMTTMAAQVAIAIENATLYERIARQEKRLEQDLALARELQFRLLPQKLPVFKNAEVASRFAPARQIGGDLYDFLKYSGHGVTGIAVGDVSGKGAPAAIYAALVSGIARSHAMEEPSAAGMLEAINLSLAERPIDGQYVSMIYADLGRQPAAAATAPTPACRGPLYCHDGKVEEIQATGLPIGLFPSATYDELSLRVPARRCVSVLQRRHSRCHQFAKGEMFGRHRLEKIAESNAHRSAEELVDAIFTAVSTHAEGVEAFDDQTIVALKVKGHRRGESPRNESEEVKSHRQPNVRRASPTARNAEPSTNRTASCMLRTIPLTRLAERFGTPLYVYSASTIRDRYREFDRAFRVRAHHLLLGKGEFESVDSADAGGAGRGIRHCLGGELQRVIAAAPKATAKVVFSGVGKQADEIDQALRAGHSAVQRGKRRRSWNCWRRGRRIIASPPFRDSGEPPGCRENPSLHLHRTSRAQVWSSLARRS